MPQAAPFTSQFSADEKRLVVEAAHQLMRNDSTMNQVIAAAKAGRETFPGRAVEPKTVVRWAQQMQLPLSGTRETTQAVAVRAKQFYASQRREDQRQKIFDLVDMELDRIRTALMTSPQSDLSLNLASRLQSLASTHASLAAQSRADQLHKMRLEDINPMAEATSLDDWDGTSDHLPPDVSLGILDINASRRRSAVLRSGS